METENKPKRQRARRRDYAATVKELRAYCVASIATLEDLGTLLPQAPADANCILLSGRLSAFKDVLRRLDA
jgi:hypothetical protein